MDDFETFKASREKIDPTSRKMTEHQWQQAYAAYCNSRERVKEGHKSKSGDGSKHRRSSSSRSASAVGHSPIIHLRNEVRRNSAYSDLRMIIDLLSWFAIGVIVLTGAVKLVYYTNGSAALVAILSAVTQVIAVVALRLLIHVVVDIPDIALHERLTKEAAHNDQNSGE